MTYGNENKYRHKGVIGVGVKFKRKETKCNVLIIEEYIPLLVIVYKDFALIFKEKLNEYIVHIDILISGNNCGSSLSIKKSKKQFSNSLSDLLFLLFSICKALLAALLTLSSFSCSSLHL